MTTVPTRYKTNAIGIHATGNYAAMSHTAGAVVSERTPVVKSVDGLKFAGVSIHQRT